MVALTEAKGLEGLDELVRNVAESLDARAVGSRDDIKRFGALICDCNPIHTDLTEARKQGFEDTPAHGILICAHAERYTKEILGRVKAEAGIDAKCEELEVLLKEPAYPGNGFGYTFVEVSNRDGIARIRGKILEKGKKRTIAIVNATISGGLEDGRQNWERRFHQRYGFSAKDVSDFYNALGFEPSAEIPLALVSSGIPAALISHLKEKAQGDDRALLRALRVSVQGVPGIDSRGYYDAEICSSGGPREGFIRGKKVFLYDVRGLCTWYEPNENGAGVRSVPILKGDVLVASSSKVAA
jgi:acyl dehydratase